MARCFAVAINHAPGLSGTPERGHCSSAATSASWARSSARPTSRTIRAIPAMSLADSILQMASIFRCVSEAVTAIHHTIFSPPAQVLHEQQSGSRWEVFRPEDLAHLGFAFPGGPMRLVKLHEFHRRLDGLFLGFQFKNRISAHDLFGLGKRPIDDIKFSSRDSDSG